ncbi:MAG: recombination directionality factor [Actinomycetota bacterium]
MSILSLQRRYRELGRLRAGEKGPKGEPRKLDRWRLTTPSHELAEQVALMFGGKAAEWQEAPTQGTQWEVVTEREEIEVYVPPQDLDRAQYLELWSAGGVKRRCDSMTELISGRPCMCDPDNRECKITTHLLVILPQIPDVGVWRLTSHGWNAAAELPATINLLGHVHAEGAIPAAVLGLEQRTKVVDGKTRHFAVPVLRLPWTIAEAERAGVPVLTQGKRAVPALPSERPDLPEDAAFAEHVGAAWGPPPALPDEKADAAVTREQIVKLHAMANELGFSDKERHHRAGMDSFNDLTKARASELIEEWGSASSGREVGDPAATGAAQPFSGEPVPPDPEQRPKVDPEITAGPYRGKRHSEIVQADRAYVEGMLAEARAKARREAIQGWLDWSAPRLVS